jgi:hypothetical protein
MLAVHTTRIFLAPVPVVGTLQRYPAAQANASARHALFWKIYPDAEQPFVRVVEPP